MFIANVMKFPILKCHFKNVTTLNSKFIEARNANEKRNLLNKFDTRYCINLSE
jgi:hypothetical protein